ncbi:hypothetical protein SDC9_106676 [bioreactor metagenome]|uniref:Uncharacterized protein n=1 Tax=bioreactor metagenome TaxID=1076179 RepID=A0A645B2Z0_9ZZZZ
MIHRHLQIEDVVVACVEGHAARFRGIQIGIHTQIDLLVQADHLGLTLRDMGLQFALHLAGEVANDLVHQLAHDVAHIVRGIGTGQIALGHAHGQQIAAVELHGRIGREVDDDERRKTTIDQHKAADIGFETCLGDALHHARVLNRALGGHLQHARDGVAQGNQHIFGAVDDGGGGLAHGCIGSRDR